MSQEESVVWKVITMKKINNNKKLIIVSISFIHIIKMYWHLVISYCYLKLIITYINIYFLPRSLISLFRCGQGNIYITERSSF